MHVLNSQTTTSYIAVVVVLLSASAYVPTVFITCRHT